MHEAWSHDAYFLPSAEDRWPKNRMNRKDLLQKYRCVGGNCVGHGASGFDFDQSDQPLLSLETKKNVNHNSQHNQMLAFLLWKKKKPKKGGERKGKREGKGYKSSFVFVFSLVHFFEILPLLSSSSFFFLLKISQSVGSRFVGIQKKVTLGRTKEEEEKKTYNLRAILQNTAFLCQPPSLWLPHQQSDEKSHFS